jgi:hypothetical protein
LDTAVFGNAATAVSMSASVRCSMENRAYVVPTTDTPSTVPAVSTTE